MFVVRWWLALVKSLCLTEKVLTVFCRCVVVRSTWAQLDLRGHGCVVVGVLPSAWIVQLTLPMWIGVCTSYAHDFALSNPAKSYGCMLLPS